MGSVWSGSSRTVQLRHYADNSADLQFYTVATWWFQAAALTLLLINKTFICVALLTVSLESRCFIITKSLIISAKEVKWEGGVWPVGVQENSRRNIRDEMRNISRCRITRCAQTRHPTSLNGTVLWNVLMIFKRNWNVFGFSQWACNQPANAH